MMHKMPRTLPNNNRWRIVSVALIFLAALYSFAGLRAGAQKATAGTTPAAQKSQQKKITPVSATATPEGSRITITSDGALSDYSAYRSGDRYYVLIPEVDASRLVNGLRGRGFEDVRMQKRGNDVLVSFRLLAGAAARVEQKFNKLVIVVTVPALAAANTSATNSNTGGNTNVRPQPTPSNNTNTASVANTNTRTPAGTNTPPLNNTNANTAVVVTQPNPIGPNPNTATNTNPNFTNPPAGIPAGPDEAGMQSGTSGFPPVTQTSPLVTPSATPVDQIAQMQQPNGIPATNVPITTTSAPTPASGTSLGATLKQNWLLVLLAAVVLGLIAWVLVARSKAERSPAELRTEKLREAKNEAILDIVPPKKAAVVTPLATPPVVAPVPVPVEAEAEPVAVESAPDVSSVVVPLAAVAVGEEAKQLEPAAPVAVERASEEVTNLLAGHPYDEAVINTQDSAARQMITAELLAALAGRNTVRQERAREAFVKHGYFDDATRTLRTAEASAERASAARSLGLSRDSASTPHLVAALEDDSPEVRRAAVESLAEVRDSAAVAPLEALRDRERDRRIPKALIQHAIEASVVGRAKAETTTPIPASYATTPLSESHVPATTPLDAEAVAPSVEEIVEETEVAETPVEAEASQLTAEPVAEAAVESPAEAAIESPAESVAPQFAEEISVEEVEQPQPAPLFAEAPAESVAAEPVAAPPDAEEFAPAFEAEAAPPLVEETPAVEAETEPAPIAEPEVVAEEASLSPQVAPPAPVPEETPAPVATAEPDTEYKDSIVSEWVDVDVNTPEISDQPASAPITPAAQLEESPVAEAAPETVMPQAAAESIEPITEPLPESFTPAMQADVSQAVAPETVAAPVASTEAVKGLDVAQTDKEIEAVDEDQTSVPSAILRRLASEEAAERASAVSELGRISGDDAFREISASFDDPSPEVRNAAARALFNLAPDRAGSFTRALREATPERRRHIGAALASSGLATEAIGHLMGESREKTYDAFSLLFLMSKAGEVQPLMRAVEEHPNNEVRLAVVKLLALSGQQEILPAFRRLAVRGSLPTEVRSAVMEAIYQISSQTPDAASRS
jgi:HEAT repeat protein